MKRLLTALLLVACNDREVFHEPDPSLARMLEQRRADTWEPGVMRDPPTDTVARDDDTDDPPPPVTRELVVIGRADFETICATCHGIRGDGKSVVATKMEHRPPPSLHAPRAMALTRSQLFAVITKGYGLMPSFAATLPPRERWAVIAYLDALRLSQGAKVADLPPDLRDALARKVAP